MPITGVLYGPVDRVPFVYASPNCVGNETSLLDCLSSGQLQLGETGFYQDEDNSLKNSVAVRCEGGGIRLCSATLFFLTMEAYD